MQIPASLGEPITWEILWIHLVRWLLSKRARDQKVKDLEAWALPADLLVTGEQNKSLQIQHIGSGDTHKSKNALSCLCSYLGS